MKDFNLLGTVVLVCVLSGAAMPAAAATVTPGPATALEFTVKTVIEPRCGWSPSGAPMANVDLGSLDVDGSKDIPFEVDCNTPFLFSALSENRRLVKDAPIADLPSSFVQGVNYRVNVRLGVRQADGTVATVSETCGSQTLGLEGMCAFAQGSPLLDDFTGESIATSADTALPRSRLRVFWNGPDEGGPTRVAGTYSDVLTISVQAKS
jgi:hypothetical protein